MSEQATAGELPMDDEYLRAILVRQQPPYGAPGDVVSLVAEVRRLRDQIERIREDAERIRSWGTALHADQDGSLSCILRHCADALGAAPAAEGGE